MRDPKKLKIQLLNCLVRNQLFDAALSAIGYTLITQAILDNPQLVSDDAGYVITDITAPNGTFKDDVDVDSIIPVEVFIGSFSTVENIVNCAEYIIEKIKEAWLRVSSSTTLKMIDARPILSIRPNVDAFSVFIHFMTFVQNNTKK